MVLCTDCFSTPELARGELVPDEAVCEGCGALTTVYLYRHDPKTVRETTRGVDGRINE